MTLHCPHCQHEITEAEIKRLWAQYTASKQTPHAGPGRPKGSGGKYSGGQVWRKHNPNTSRCRCASCNAARQSSK